jgi:glycosyltransferase involved in cell wall biosynthesis
MRITLVGPAYPLRGGIAHHVYWLKRELSSRNHEVQVISFRSLYPRLLFPGTTVFDASRLKLDAGGAAILDSLNPLTWLKAARAIKSFAPDAVVIQWWNPFFAPSMGTLARLLKRARLRCIMECHNVLPHERRAIDAPLLKYALSPADYLITHSTGDKKDAMEIAPGKAVEVAPLPTIEDFSGGASARRDGRTILFFGIVRKYKGLDVLLRAMPRALSEVDCRLIVVGEFYEPVEKYNRLIGELGLERSVTIENRYVANEEVPALFAAADVLVLPYLSATQSGVARIALANSLPIIASRTGGLSEVVIEKVNGLLFAPGDADALAECIIEYFKNGLGSAFAANLKSSLAAGEEPSVISVIEKMVAARSLCGKSI